MRVLGFNLFLLVACLSWAGLNAAAQATVINGTVEHSEYMQPAEGFRLGEKLDESLLPQGDEAKGQWWRVPHWLAGKWHKTGRIDVLSFTNLQTNQPVLSKKRLRVSYPEDEVLGHQRGRDGSVWTYTPIPYVMKTYSGSRTNVSVLRSFDVIDEDERSFTIKMFIFTVVTEGDDKVLSVTQRECLQTLTPVAEDKISIVESTKFFDREGIPIYTKKTQTFSEKCGDYCQTNFIDGKTHRPLTGWNTYRIPECLKGSNYLPTPPIDLRNSFADFLKAKNLTSIIP